MRVRVRLRVRVRVRVRVRTSAVVGEQAARDERCARGAAAEEVHDPAGDRVAAERAAEQRGAWDVLLDRGQQLVVLPDHLHPRARRLGDERPHERRDLRQHVTLLRDGREDEEGAQQVRVVLEAHLDQVAHEAQPDGPEQRHAHVAHVEQQDEPRRVRLVDAQQPPERLVAGDRLGGDLLGGHVATDGRLLQLAGPQAIDGPCAPVVAHQRDAP